MQGSILFAVAISKLIDFIEFMILIRVLFSWLPFSNDNIIFRIVYTLTEPILKPIRNLIRKSPLGGGGVFIDFSPAIAVMLLYLIQSLIFRILGVF